MRQRRVSTQNEKAATIRKLEILNDRENPKPGQNGNGKNGGGSKPKNHPDIF